MARSSARWTGRVHDGQALICIRRLLEDSYYLNTMGMLKYLFCCYISLVTLAHEATCTSCWIVTKTKNFNRRLSRARVVVEHAYGRLKGWWRFLLKRFDHHAENVPYIISSSVTLHNISELFGDNFQDDWQVPQSTEHHSTTAETCK